MIYVRVVLYVLWLILGSFIGLLMIPFRWGDPKLNHDFAQILVWGGLKVTGVQVVREGYEKIKKTQPCVYVANHQSGLDIATLGTAFPEHTVVIGKTELRWIPVFGLLFMDPIPTTGLTIADVESLSARTRAAMLDALKDFEKRKS